MIRRYAIAAVVLLAGVVSCRQEHPIKVYVNPKFTGTASTTTAVKIAVFTVASSLHDTEDPDNIAPATLSKFLIPALDQRTDYKFIAPNTVEFAVSQNGWDDRYARFLRGYGMGGKADMAFLADMAGQLQCDAFLLTVVDLWQKDEADIRENTTPATYVGATMTVMAKDGTILFKATDENYEEGARTEVSDRQLVTSGSGAVYADLGAKVHRAPPFEDVAVKVARALASSLPPR